MTTTTDLTKRGFNRTPFGVGAIWTKKLADGRAVQIREMADSVVWNRAMVIASLQSAVKVPTTEAIWL